VTLATAQLVTVIALLIVGHAQEKVAGLLAGDGREFDDAGADRGRDRERKRLG
jgi:hypothetical protein